MSQVHRVWRESWREHFVHGFSAVAVTETKLHRQSAQYGRIEMLL